MPFIIIGGLIAIFVIWGIGVQRRLVAMDENVNNAMSQIGVQLSSRFDALTALLDLAKGYAAHESQTLIETIKSRRSVITATSTPGDVLKQEGIISEALSRISMVAERYPELKASESYKKCMDAVDSYEKMVRTSRLIYNDSVTRLNRELRMFPTSLLGGMFGFRQRDYLEAVEEKAEMPSMKCANETEDCGHHCGLPLRCLALYPVSGGQPCVGNGARCGPAARRLGPYYPGLDHRYR